MYPIAVIITFPFLPIHTDGDRQTLECIDKSAPSVFTTRTPAIGRTSRGTSQTGYNGRIECNHWRKYFDRMVSLKLVAIIVSIQHNVDVRWEESEPRNIWPMQDLQHWNCILASLGARFCVTICTVGKIDFQMRFWIYTFQKILLDRNVAVTLWISGRMVMVLSRIWFHSLVIVLSSFFR